MCGSIYVTNTHSNTALHYKATQSTLNSIKTSCGKLCLFGYDHCWSFSVQQLWICINYIAFVYLE